MVFYTELQKTIRDILHMGIKGKCGQMAIRLWKFETGSNLIKQFV